MAGNVPQPGETNPRRIVQSVRELYEGRNNAGGSVTLTPDATSTVVTAVNCGPESRPLLTPTTANAAAALATSYVSAVRAGGFTITHASNAQTDRTFNWVALG